jgi:flagellar biogenesis protein FliO
VRGAPTAAALLALSGAWAEGLPESASISSAYYVGQLLISLLLVVALIYAVQHLARRWGVVGLRPRQQGPAALVQSLPLGGGHTVHVVRVGTRTMVVGASPGGLRLLADLDAGEGPVSEPCEEGDGG